MICKSYARIFARNIFRKFNILLFHLSLRGLGVLNWQNDRLSGEKEWANHYLRGKQAPVVLDVGANIGKWSNSIHEINKGARIFAFEPHPKNYTRLVEHVGDKASPFNLAVGDERSTLELFDYEANDGSSHASLYREVISDIHGSNCVSHSVEVIRLDDFLDEHGIEEVDLLKIDTEGNELQVLRGAERHLKKRCIKAIQFEFNEMNIVSKASFKDFWNMLAAQYNLYRLLPGGGALKIKSYSPVFCEIYAYQNIVALLKE